MVLRPGVDVFDALKRFLSIQKVINGLKCEH